MCVREAGVSHGVIREMPTELAIISEEIQHVREIMLMRPVHILHIQGEDHVSRMPVRTEPARLIRVLHLLGDVSEEDVSRTGR